MSPSQKALQQREDRLSVLREASEIAYEARQLARDLADENPEAFQAKIEKYSLLAAQSFLSSGQSAPALAQYVWLKSYFPLSDTVSRLSRQLAQAIGKNPSTRSAHSDESMPVPTPYQELKARVSFEEFGSDEGQRDQLNSEKLRNFPLLNYLRSIEVLKLLETAEYVYLRKGEVLYRESDPSHSVHLLATGGIILESSSQLSREISEGDFFGDISYFLCTPHSAQAKAKYDSEVICFPRTPLQAAFERVPRLHQALTDLVYQKIFLACSRESLIFRHLSLEQLAEAWNFFTPIHVPAGRVLMEPERVCDRFFLILKGRVEVRKEGQPTVRVGSGHFVGERGVILQKQRSAKLVCLSDCHLLECDEWTYEELCESFPEMKRAVEARREEIESYQFSSKNFVVD